mgnify:CR=1 FL=1
MKQIQRLRQLNSKECGRASGLKEGDRTGRARGVRGRGPSAVPLWSSSWQAGEPSVCEPNKRSRGERSAGACAAEDTGEGASCTLAGCAAKAAAPCPVCTTWCMRDSKGDKASDNSNAKTKAHITPAACPRAARRANPPRPIRRKPDNDGVWGCISLSPTVQRFCGT